VSAAPTADNVSTTSICISFFSRCQNYAGKGAIRTEAPNTNENTRCYGSRAEMILKAVVPAAGLGTRLLSATKEQPKEMLPVFALGEDGALCLKPMVQRIFEQLFDFGVREFYFIVGREKRAIQDHFTPDCEFVRRLDLHGKIGQALGLKTFYRNLQSCSVVWVNQPEPKGFGDAVLQARPLIGTEPFLVHAGDTYIMSESQSVHARLVGAHRKGGAEATLIVKEIQDPRRYGVAEVVDANTPEVQVTHVVEKPDQPVSRLAIMPIYVFNPTIFEALRVTPPGKSGEIQLTDAIQKLIDGGSKVQAVKLKGNDIRLDIGSPETYWEALEITYNLTVTARAVRHN
jgi:UTP--glucose-1-phosphate uridylyltransferase